MNGINPLKLLQLKGAWEQFQIRHPKFPAFLNAAAGINLKEGTIIDVTITSPDGGQIGTNLKLTAEDLQLFQELKEMIQEHVACTNSAKGKKILDNFEEYIPKVKKIIPHDYERMMSTIVAMEEKGLSPEAAQIEAFYANTRK